LGTKNQELRSQPEAKHINNRPKFCVTACIWSKRSESRNSLNFRDSNSSTPFAGNEDARRAINSETSKYFLEQRFMTESRVPKSWSRAAARRAPREATINQAKWQSDAFVCRMAQSERVGEIRAQSLLCLRVVTISIRAVTAVNQSITV
jgi:hypothetical protein